MALRNRLQSAARACQCKLRTRRIILMDSCMEHVAERDPQAKVRPLRRLDVYLTRPRDRELFDLPTMEMS